MYCGLFPTDTDDYQDLREALEKLQVGRRARGCMELLFPALLFILPATRVWARRLPGCTCKHAVYTSGTISGDC